MRLNNLVEAQHQWETPEFRQWFGHSIVRDRNGNPQRVYHGAVTHRNGIGTLDSFDRLAVSRLNKWKPDFNSVGSWFSDNPTDEGAGKWTGGAPTDSSGAVMYPVYLHITNPWRPLSWDHFIQTMRVKSGLTPEPVAPKGGFAPPRGSFDPTGFREWLIDNGYDGIMFGPEIHIDSKVPQRIWVALHPEQIKSAIGNRGTFDRQSPLIVENVQEQLAALTKLGDRSRIPNEEWLARKQKYAEEDAREAAANGRSHGFALNTLSGAVTANVYVILPTKMVLALPGLSLEHEPGPEQRGRGTKAEYLRPSMKKGYSSYTQTDAVFVVVNHLGQAWIAEGNNRTAVAAELGIETIPVNVRYFNGGERVDGPMSPVSLLRASHGVISERREEIPLTKLSGEVTILLDPSPEEFLAFLRNSKSKELRGTLVIDKRQRVPVVWDAFDADHHTMAAALRSQGLQTIKNYPLLEFAITPGYGTRNVAHTGMVQYGPIFGTRSQKFAETILAIRLRRMPAAPAEA